MSTVIHRFAPTRVGCTVTVVSGGPAALWRRTRSVIGSGATHATHTLTDVRVSRRSTGPATMPGSDAKLSGTSRAACASRTDDRVTLNERTYRRQRSGGGSPNDPSAGTMSPAQEPATSGGASVRLPIHRPRYQSERRCRDLTVVRVTQRADSARADPCRSFSTPGAATPRTGGPIGPVRGTTVRRGTWSRRRRKELTWSQTARRKRPVPPSSRNCA